MAHSRIYLVGFMGAGKSTVGRVLAKRLGWKFVDLDREIERVEGQSIAQIFQAAGETRFRELEQEHFARISKRHHMVVALGGGAFLNPVNRDLADSTGSTIWLKVSFTTVCARVKMDGSRPKFASREKAEVLFKSREPLYQLARIHIDADGRSPMDIADEVIGEVRGQ